MSLLKTIGLKLIGDKHKFEIELAAVQQAESGIRKIAVAEAKSSIEQDALLNQSYESLRWHLLTKLFINENNAQAWVQRASELKAEQKNPVVLRSKVLKEIKARLQDSTRAAIATDLILDVLK